MCLAVPGRVDALVEREGILIAEVDFGGVRKDVCCVYVPDVQVGEYVIVHVGFAIQRLDEDCARATLAQFAAMGLLEQEFGDQEAAAARPPGPVPAAGAGEGGR